MNRKFSASLLVSLAVAAVMPLAASAITIGVSDEVDTTILSGHLCQQSSSYSNTSGTEWSSSVAAKVGYENDSSSTSASVTDPAASAGTSSGKFAVSDVTTSGSSGVYKTGSQSSSSISDGFEAQTSIVNTVSTFANP